MPNYEIQCNKRKATNAVELWQFNKTVIECNQYMLETGLASDVTFIVGNGDERQEFKAHKYVLLSRSPVFYTMFCGELAESGAIAVTDVTPEAFRQMLNYIYTDKADLDSNHVIFVLHASKKYMIPGLTAKCIAYLTQHVDTTNVCTILEQSLLFDEPELAAKCLKLIKTQTKPCLESKSFLTVNKNTLGVIMDSDTFTLKELEVFELCLKWAVQKCKDKNLDATGRNKRELFGDYIYKFRFCEIEVSDFARVVALSGVLTRDEENALFRHIANKDIIPPPKEFAIGKRYKPSKAQLMTTHTLQKVNIKSEINVTLDCSEKITMKSILLGNWKDLLVCSNCNGQYARVEIKTTITINNEPVVISEMVDIDGEKMEYKLKEAVDIDNHTVINVQLTIVCPSCGYNFNPTSCCPSCRSLICCYNCGSYSNCNMKGFAIPRKNAVMQDDFINLSLSSNQRCIPIAGIKYSI